MKIEDAEAIVEEARGIESRASFLRETIQRIHAEERAAVSPIADELIARVQVAQVHLSLNNTNKFHVDYVLQLSKLMAHARRLEVELGIRGREVRGPEPADAAS